MITSTGQLERVDAELAVAAEGQRPDVTGLEAVGRDHLVRGLAQLLDAVRQLHEVDLAGALEAPQVVHQPEDGRAAIGRVGANALEDAGAVVHRVAQHVHLGVRPGHELAVHPDLLGLLHATLSRGANCCSLYRVHARGQAARWGLAPAAARQGSDPERCVVTLVASSGGRRAAARPRRGASPASPGWPRVGRRPARRPSSRRRPLPSGRASCWRC